MNQPTYFRVIGIGHDTSEIIDRVNSFGYNYVSATVIPYPQTCLPTDEDKMVIIVAKGCRSHASSIAKGFHDAVFPENIEVYWGTYRDDTINDHDIKITILASGKKLIHR